MMAMGEPQVTWKQPGFNGWRALSSGMADIYHYTDTSRLPWIIQSGELRPGSNAIGGFPKPDFLWATSDPQGDRTASANRGEHWRTGRLWHARFVFDSADFVRWTDSRDSLPGWTTDHVRLLEATKDAEPAAWWYRTEPISIDECLGLEFRSYTSKSWRNLGVTRPTEMENGSLFIMVDDKKPFCSARQAMPAYGGAYAYQVL